jgi:DNA-binding CsgD family transcriptional regulator
MERAAKQAIGIYDERTLQRQMLHHNLERMQYEVLYSCRDIQEFIKNYVIYPVDIILYNAENGPGKVEEMLKQLSVSRKLSLLLYYGYAYAEQLNDLKQSYNVELFFCNGTWEDIIVSLDKIVPAEQKDGNMPVTSIAPDNPFYNIAANKTCVRILELLREGKSIKQISAITGNTEANINYYLKKMRHETGCLSVLELVMDAKEIGVL